ncbi:T-complex protein 11-domain-containing protein [Flagelloscypha sp. PMI_526]|nr:T-complex protein 11-domain-containing protein [Flagelloscypha sp. PMI_526]
MDFDPVPSPQDRKRKLDEDDDGQPRSSTPRLCPPTILRPDGATKRRRVDQPIRRRRVGRKQPSSSRRFTTRCGPTRIGSDLEDMGITLSAVTTPATGSLLSLHRPYTLEPYNKHPHIVFGPHVPSLYPPINRHSLNDLDLSHVLRNPQLRHDLLFDPGLHFRPASHRKKDDASDKYWDAVIKELSTGCTCLSFDPEGEPVPCICACELTPSSTPLPWIVTFANEGIVTVRTPPRLRNLLDDFLDLLLLVIQPLSRASGMYLNPTSVQTQIEEHAAHAHYIRTVFDPALIEQELLCRIFDPSGIFELIADTLKRHCAPMRDSAISAFVAKGLSSEKGAPANSTDAVLALRMCMDVLELMQLDIANHQLHCLRPYITKSARSYELDIFESEMGPDSALSVTQAWIHESERKLKCADDPIFKAPYFSNILSWELLPRNTQVYVCVLRGLVDLVFCPPTTLPPISNGPPATPLRQPTAPLLPLPGYPETTFLDNSRLQQLTGDALDLVAMHMYLLLFRQLLLSGPPSSRQAEPDLSQLKSLRNEILDLSGSRPGHSILPSHIEGQSELKKSERQQKLQASIVLHVVLRATQLKRNSSSGGLDSCPVDPTLLSVAQNWAEQHLHSRSTLLLMLKDRVRELVFRAVLSLTMPPSVSSTRMTSESLFSHLLAEPSASGLTPLRSHFRLISERTSTLAHYHLNTYLPLYEQKTFLDT